MNRTAEVRGLVMDYLHQHPDGISFTTHQLAMALEITPCTRDRMLLGTVCKKLSIRAVGILHQRDHNSTTFVYDGNTNGGNATVLEPLAPLETVEPPPPPTRLKYIAFLTWCVGHVASVRESFKLSTAELLRVFCIRLGEERPPECVWEDPDGPWRRDWRWAMADMASTGYIKYGAEGEVELTVITMPYWKEAMEAAEDNVASEDESFYRLAQDIRSKAKKKQILPARWGPWGLAPQGRFT